MGDKAVRVENLSKRYEIGAVKLRYDTLRDQIMESLKTVISGNGYSRQERNIIWALKDVSLEIEQGEVVGIIGRNGARQHTQRSRS
jgi:lipopolysaccharide transport system ATP-binding protein